MAGWAGGGSEGDSHLLVPWYEGYKRKLPRPKGPTRKAAAPDELGLCSRSLMFQTTHLSNSKGMIT